LESLNLEPDNLVLVACSGGADSLALAATAQLASGQLGRTTRKRGIAIRVGAAIVDHGLQTGSADVAATAAAQCVELGLQPVIIKTVRVGSDGGPEAAAREARHNALQEAASETQAKAVLLGHTLDDQAEQVLLSLARGSGTKSIAGIPAARGVFRRPFLGVTRETTEQICVALRLKPWHDPTNSLAIPARNKIRLNVMPLLTQTLGNGVKGALARTASLARADDEALEYYADRLFVSALQGAGTSKPKPPGFALSIAVLSQAPQATRRRTLKKAAEIAGATKGRLQFSHIETIDSLISNWRGQRSVELPGGVTVLRNKGELWLNSGGFSSIIPKE
jgi:tRNA(Ile)-lysidine synthase